MGRKSHNTSPALPVTLKSLAAYLNLHPATVSVVLNNVPGRTIPDSTRQRIKETAQQLGYFPNVLARSLRTKRTKTIGIMVPDVCETYYGQIISGISSRAAQLGYCYMGAHHGYDDTMVPHHLAALEKRGVEGLVLIDTSPPEALSLPTVLIGNREPVAGTIAIELDQHRAILLAMQHLCSRGYKRAVLIDNPIEKTGPSRLTERMAQLATMCGIDFTTIDLVSLGEQRNAKKCRKSRSSLAEFRSDDSAMIALDIESAETALCALGLQNGIDANEIPMIFIDPDGRGSPDLPMTVIRQSLKRTGEIAVDSLLREIGGFTHEHTIIGIEPEIVTSKTA